MRNKQKRRSHFQFNSRKSKAAAIDKKNEPKQERMKQEKHSGIMFWEVIQFVRLYNNLI